jgi:adenylate kinase family enzyme
LVYRDQTEQLISYFRGGADCIEIKAEQSVQAVTTQILAALKNK